jgi:hypothetical protein
VVQRPDPPLLPDTLEAWREHTSICGPTHGRCTATAMFTRAAVRQRTGRSASEIGRFTIAIAWGDDLIVHLHALGHFRRNPWVR